MAASKTLIIALLALICLVSVAQAQIPCRQYGGTNTECSPRMGMCCRSGLTCSSHATLDKTKTFCSGTVSNSNEVPSANGGVTQPTAPGATTGNKYPTTPTSAIPNLSGAGRKMMH